MTFLESPTPSSKDMWWRTQLQTYLDDQEARAKEERLINLDRQWSTYQYGSDRVAPVWRRTFPR